MKKAGKKVKPPLKKKTTKKVIKRSAVKTKKATVKKVKLPGKQVPAKKKSTSKLNVKGTIKKPVSRNVNPKGFSAEKRKTKRTRREKVKTPAFSSTYVEVKNRGEDLHFIPQHEAGQPITTQEVHTSENNLNHKEDVTFRQENKKVPPALFLAKKIKRIQRRRGKR